MKTIAAIALFIGLCTPAFSQSKLYSFVTIASKPGDTTVQNILVVCEGTSGARLFLETLSDKMNDVLLSQNIKATYYYSGAERRESDAKVAEYLKTGSFDAILKFTQSNEEGMPIVWRQGFGTAAASAVTGIAIYQRDIYYKQIFIVNFESCSDKNIGSWKARLDTHFDFTNQKKYNALIKKMMQNFYDVSAIKPNAKK